MKDKLASFYNTTNQLTGGGLGLGVDIGRRFGEMRAAEAAAGMAYYFFFALFPLLIFLVAMGSFLLEGEEVQRQISQFLEQVLPAAVPIVEKNLEMVISQRGSVGLVAAIGLLWSASGAFSVLARNINRAWPKSEMQSFLRGRLVALSMVAVLAGLLVLSLFSKTLMGFVFRYLPGIAGGEMLQETILWKLGINGLPILFGFLMFFGMYRWIPTAEVGMWDAFWGAVVASVVWQVANAGFSWYINSGLAGYQAIYGALAAVIILLFWIYLTSIIILAGAAVSAAVSGFREKKRAERLAPLEL